MKYRLLSLLAIASFSNSSPAIAQTYPDITGRWMLESISRGYEQIIEFENNSTGLQVWQDAPSFPVANDVTRSGNRIESSWFCRGYCYMEGQINEDGLSGVLEVSARDERGNPIPDRQPSAYRLTKITDEYCPVTGVWNYYSESDFIYNPNSGFAEGGPPYRATVNITEDKDRNIIISGFYNMSSGDGTGDRRLNSLNVTMPLAPEEGEMYARISDDNREITGAIHLMEERHKSNAMIQFTMTRQTECRQSVKESPSTGGVIEDVLDLVF